MLWLACYLAKQWQRNRSTSLNCENPNSLLKKLCFKAFILIDTIGCAKQVFLKCWMTRMASIHLSKTEKFLLEPSVSLPENQCGKEKKKKKTLIQNPNLNHANYSWIIKIKIQAHTPSPPCNREGWLLSKTPEPVTLYLLNNKSLAIITMHKVKATYKTSP